MTRQRKDSWCSKKKLAVPLAFCNSVGGRALANTWQGCWVAFSPYNNGPAREQELGMVIVALDLCGAQHRPR